MNARETVEMDWQAVKRDLARQMAKLGEPLSGRQWTKIRKALQRRPPDGDSRSLHENPGVELGSHLHESRG